MKNIILIAFLGLVSQSAFSQASLEISIIDSLQNAVGSQAVSITNPEIGFQKDVISSSKGIIQLTGLSTSGRYSISVKEGSFFKAQMLRNISLVSGKTTSVSVVLSEKVNALQGVTIIARDYQTINTINAEVASELTEKEIREIPVEGRDITRVLYRLPNITQATGFYPEAPNVSINGANGLYTNYLIDGLDNNENFLGGQRFAMPVGFTKNITALTNNFSAEYGLSSNGVINITTKSGTNETHGEAFFVTRPGPAIDSPSRFAQRDLSGNQVKDGFQRYQAGFGVGGALVKNKTFYFLNYEHTTDIKDNLLNVPQLGINETVQGRNSFDYISGKIDQVWSDKFTSSLRINAGLANIERQGGGLDGGVKFPSAGDSQKRNSLNIALKNSYQNSKFAYEGNFQYSRFDWDYAEPENSNDPNVTVLDTTFTPVAVLGHPGFVFRQIENTSVVQQKVVIFLGDHKLKTGFQLKSSGHELFGGGNPNGSYTVLANPTQIQQINELGLGSGLRPQDIPGEVNVTFYGIELRPSSFLKTQNIYSLYAEDQWTVSSKLNVTAGLRYDYDNISKGGGDQGDFDNLGPRLSANYKLNERTSLRAGYSVSYDRVLYAIYSDALQFNSNSEDYKKQIQQLIDLGVLPSDTDINQVTNEGNITANDNSVSYLEGPSSTELQGQREMVFQNELRILNPNGYDNPYSHQFMLGFQRKITDNSLFYVDLIHNRSHNLARIRNLNAPAAYDIDTDNVEVRSPDAADATRPVAIFNDDGSYGIIDGQRVNGIARNVVMTEMRGRSNYYALNFTLQKDRGDENYALRMIYTLSYLENNTEDINFRAMDSNMFGQEWGPSINDRTHLINGIFNYYPLENLTLTLAALLQSGQPINRIPDATIYGTTDLNGDGQGFGDSYVGNSDRSPGEDRNNDRLPWSNTFDLSAFYSIPIGEDKSFEIGAQIFNLFNTENLSGYSNNATQSNQIQIGPADSGVIVRRNAAPPRQFQFSARYLF